MIALALRLILCGSLFGLVSQVPCAAESRPNIVWIVSEDHGPHLGCYGDPFASTPNVDRLASQGMIYTHAWSNAPVCAPARTTLISGLYAPSTGGEHMRSMVPYPAGKQMFPQLLRAVGYYCTNNAKEDYNLTQPGQVWDESSKRGHWKNRPKGQPFFAVFNSEKSHESRIRARPHLAVHEAAKVRLPAYHPDTPEVRKDWAQYYDCVSQADADAGTRLRELEEAGLRDETIVFYFADHGSGMPRNKRWPYDSGLHVPLVVYIPQKLAHLRPAGYAAGGKSDRLVSFVDFAPTVLSLAGTKPPDWMQGHAFLGPFAEPSQPCVYGFRGRMDERYDLVRSVTDGRFVYVRNFMPHKIYGQHVSYMFQTPTTQVWQRLHAEGRLNPSQDIFWKEKSPEELYDLASDPDEVTNLAGSPDHAEVRRKLAAAQRDLALQIRDLGFLPEGEIHDRSEKKTPYDMAREGDRYPLERILPTAELAAGLDPKANEMLIRSLAGPSRDPDSAVRYWAALGLLMRGRSGWTAGRTGLVASLDDSSRYVRVVAAEALARFGEPADADRGQRVLVESADWSRNNVFVVMAALNAVDALDDGGAALRESLRRLPGKGPAPHARYSEYVPRLLSREK